MTIKTVVVLILFVAPLSIISTGIALSPLMLFVLYGLSGLGTAGIGLNVMHDAIHGSYSGNRRLNLIMSNTMNLIGANATVWKIQHNVLHHTYTNINEADDDINPPFFLRFTPDAKRYWIHQYQHFYVWFFYGISTLSWVTAKDFVRMYRYRNMGFLKEKNEFRNELIKAVVWKLFYLFYALILPLIMVPLPWELIVLAFLSMHVITGSILSLIFQTAHVMPDSNYPAADKNGLIDNDWHAHQLATTSNYSPKNRLFSWMIGGLNFQIEHHLLPNICHVHYRKLAPIVKKTAHEFGVPYHSKNSFWEAIRAHAIMLRRLGQTDTA